MEFPTTTPTTNSVAFTTPATSNIVAFTGPTMDSVALAAPSTPDTVAPTPNVVAAGPLLVLEKVEIEDMR